MKYALLVLVIMLIVWLARSGGRRIPPPGPSARDMAPPDAKPQDMVACTQCGMHLPRAEALPGRGGLFCGEPHRREFEQSHAGP